MAKASPQIELSSTDGWAIDCTPSAHRALRASCDYGNTAGIPSAASGCTSPTSSRQLSGVATFVSTLAHEIRQPLSVLLAAIDIVCRCRDQAVVDEAAETMKRQVGQMNRVVEDVLDATRWARGIVSLRKQRIDVRDVIGRAARDVLPAVADSGHGFVVDCGAEPLWADADPDRLHQVLSNLLRNAVKYTEPGGQIWLLAGRQTGTFTLRVGDTGRGIEPWALPEVFDLFSQAQPSDTAGLGIGLSVAREIVTLHGGRVDAYSDGPGRGSEFVVTLPLASCEHTS